MATSAELLGWLLCYHTSHQLGPGCQADCLDSDVPTHSAVEVLDLLGNHSRTRMDGRVI